MCARTYGHGRGLAQPVMPTPTMDYGHRMVGEYNVPEAQMFSIFSPEGNEAQLGIEVACKVLRKTPDGKIPTAIHLIGNSAPKVSSIKRVMQLLYLGIDDECLVSHHLLRHISFIVAFCTTECFIYARKMMYTKMGIMAMLMHFDDGDYAWIDKKKADTIKDSLLTFDKGFDPPASLCKHIMKVL